MSKFSKKIYEEELRIYIDFALESSYNIHVASIDINNPLTSILQIFLVDIVSSQYLSDTRFPVFLIPQGIKIECLLTEKKSFLELSNDSQIEIHTLLKGNDQDDGKINKLRRRYLNENKLFEIAKNENFTPIDVPIKTDFKIAYSNKYNFTYDNTNKNYENLKKEERIKYETTVYYKLIPEKKEKKKKEKKKEKIIKIFLKKLFVLALNTKRNSRHFNTLLKESTKNALSKVMARNQSHNIGSHVLSRMVQPDDISLKKIMTGKKPKYTPIYHEETLEKQVEKEKNEILKKNTLKNCTALAISRKKYYNKLISYFLSYLKTRQDLLADIVSGVPQVQSSKWFRQDIIKGIDDNRLLLNRISGVEDFKYHFELKGSVESKIDGKDIQMAISNDIMGQHALYIILENIIRNTAKHGASKTNKDKYKFTIYVEESKLDSSFHQVTVYDDIPIEGTTYLKLERIDNSFLNGINISILSDKYIKEKIAEIKRECDNNTFGKEDEPNESGIKEFTLAFLKRIKKKIEDKESGDKKCFGELTYIGSDEEGKYDYFELSKIDHLVTMQNIWINKKILDKDTFQLRQQALGLIEMETCSAYLRRIEIDKIQAPEFLLEFSETGIKKLREHIKIGDKELRLLRAVRPECEIRKQEIENGTAEEKIYLPHLGYRFYIPKPKELLIIDEKGDLWDKCLKKKTNDAEAEDDYVHFKELESNGVLLLNASGKIKKDKINKKWIFDEKEKKVYQHSIMLLNLKEKSEIKHKLDFVKLPKRYVTFDKVNECFGLYKEKFEKKIKKFVKYDISFDLCYDSKSVLIEIWRTYILKKMLNNNINKFNNNNLNYLIPKIDDGEEYHITYHKHGKDFSWGRGNWKGEYCAIFESKFESIEKLLTPLDNTGKNILLQFKAIDTAVTNILVLDERIQELSKNTYTLQDNNSTKLEYREIWDYMHVHIPNKETINFGVKNFKSKKGYRRDLYCLIIKEFLRSDRKKKNLDYIIIHLGIIEKILKSEPDNSKNDFHIKEFLEELEKKTNAEIIITSGRAPQNLPKKYSFLSYSLLSQYLIEKRFKLHLNEVVNSSRPKIN